MYGVKGDFTGFTYNGVHSSVVGLTRVSSSNRYQLDLAPTFKDHVIDVTSGDGKHYFGTDYPKRDISVAVAFDGLEEDQLQIIKTKWADGEIHELIFDEMPYKTYSAKLDNNSVIKHICFSEAVGRVYKGEGTLKFVCYFPYGISRYEYLEDYCADNIVEWEDGYEELEYRAGLAADSGLERGTVYYDLIDSEDETVNASITTEETLDWPAAEYLTSLETETTFGATDNGTLKYGVSANESLVNIPEWAAASGIPSHKDGYGIFSATENEGEYQIKIYNAGDVEIPFQIWFRASATNFFYIELKDTDNYLVVDGLDAVRTQQADIVSNDYYYVFNSDTHSIEGYDSAGAQTKNLYNFCITEGGFFMLPVGESVLTITCDTTPHDIKFHYWYY